MGDELEDVPEDAEDRVSLTGLDPEDALRALLRVPRSVEEKDG